VIFYFLAWFSRYFHFEGRDIFTPLSGWCLLLQMPRCIFRFLRHWINNEAGLSSFEQRNRYTFSSSFLFFNRRASIFLRVENRKFSSKIMPSQLLHIGVISCWHFRHWFSFQFRHGSSARLADPSLFEASAFCRLQPPALLNRDSRAFLSLLGWLFFFH